jgi:hypothetical protein
MAKLTSKKLCGKRYASVTHAENAELGRVCCYSPENGGKLILWVQSEDRQYNLELHAGEAQILREYLNEQWENHEAKTLFKRKT